MLRPQLVFFPLVALFFALAPFAEAMAPKPVRSVRTTLAFDGDWRFLKSDAAGAEAPAFADASWRRLDVPHDWSIEGPFDEKNPTAGAGGYLPSGIAWYRKHFTLPATDQAGRVFIEFDGVMQNSDVWINGQHLGHRPFGYVSFRYELTGKINFGPNAQNVLAVRVDTSVQPASRWYSGAGIYRHVRLVVTDPVHFEQWATFVTTPEISSGAQSAATVRVESSVVNQSETPRDVALHVALIDDAGKTVAQGDTTPQTVAAGQAGNFQRELKLTDPKLWDLETPHLYRALVSVRSGGRTLDEEAVPFGIRDARFDADRGFFLNGKNFKIKGVCLHQDASAFGVAVPLSVWEQRLTALRELGVNAIRTAHNPPAPEFLELCDRMGFLVMDELFDCWTVGKPGLDGAHLQDYHLYFNEWSHRDLRDTVRRDRNHPSIILYSAGNEIHDTPNAELANKILTGLVQVFHENDPTRPVTQALFRPNVSHDYDNGLADLLDVVGQNYRENEILAAHRQKPTRKIIGTENGHDRAVWLALRDNAFYSGQFLWTGVDYLGESRQWPRVSSGSGLVDRIGEIKSSGRQRQSWWSEQPMVAIVRRIAPPTVTPSDPGYVPLNRRQTTFADWTPSQAEPHEENVEVYSNAESVELFLNDKSLGSKPLNADASPRNWKVAYAPGTLKAIASNGGKVVATDELRTAGKPAKILLVANRKTLRPIWDDVSIVVAKVVDANGVEVPNASDTVSFQVTGPGIIAAVDSADHASHELFQTNVRQAFQGECAALVKATAGKTGAITVTANAPGLAAGSLAIETSK
jgi:beta-galactosidase